MASNKAAKIRVIVQVDTTATYCPVKCRTDCTSVS